MDKWKTILALILLILAVIFEWDWFWALFILIGLVHIIRSEEINFVESVTKKEHPKLYWIMIFIWSFLALFSMFNYLV
ncbi:hypothetical protein [uncultured Tenacibaculum sp.]|uniref:hypothetical protein n=1 Tax=uncultured Tenacibaculum sp. TaxID=174713 RepID=UPI0026331FC5|nr:hypothetical protein [uncultured Tenacibaculum sp.]